jgi:hypothetical protein
MGVSDIQTVNGVGVEADLDLTHPERRYGNFRQDRPNRHHCQGEISVDRVLEYDVWTLNINSSTFSPRDRFRTADAGRTKYVGVGDTLLLI